jgi:SSS family solute:Na+ symporter
MPEFRSPLWWTLVSSVVGAVGFGVLTQPQLAVRFMSVKSGKELNRAVLSGGLFILVMTGGAFVVGALSNVLLYEATGKIAMKAAGGVNDLIIPMFITFYLPQWYGAIFMLAMLAAAMSTLSSQFHTMGTALGRDVCEQTFVKHGNSLKWSRIGILAVILISTLLAWLTKYLDGSDGIIAKGTIIFFEMTTSSFLVAYIGGLYLKKMPRLSAELSILFGTIVWFIWTFFISANAESLAICKLLTGKSSIVVGTSYASLAVVGTSIVGVIAALVGAIVGWIVDKKKCD